MLYYDRHCLSVKHQVDHMLLPFTSIIAHTHARTCCCAVGGQRSAGVAGAGTANSADAARIALTDAVDLQQQQEVFVCVCWRRVRACMRASSVTAIAAAATTLRKID